MKKLIVEFIGTFLLVFTIGCAVVSKNPNAELAIGAVLMVMVFAGGHISGAHYNPAVSLAVFIRGKIGSGELIQYWIVQLVGGLLGAIMSHVITAKDGAVEMAPGADVTPMIAVLAEALGTFALAYVVLNVATSKGTAGNSFYGLAIGFTVFAMAVSLGGISGGAFNPAVGLGRTIADTIVATGKSTANWWIYIVGPLIGGALAGIVFRMLNPEDR
ncbi:MAG TPA: MIP/aquaporin family protein [Chitinophagales bacterium]|nr:MIP/aquaporin family protein [Chitinophagales bacterium]